MKVIGSGTAERVTLASGDMEDGTYDISGNRKTARVIDACVKEEGKYDLAKGVPGVVDPIVIVKSTPRGT